MNLTHPEVKAKIDTWQNELKELSGMPVKLIVLVDPGEPDLSSKINFETIKEIVCSVTEVPFERVLKKSRKREVVVARQLICFWARNMTRYSLKDIGIMIGGKDHTTVIHSCNAVKNLMGSGDELMKVAYEKVQKYLSVKSGAEQQTVIQTTQNV